MPAPTNRPLVMFVPPPLLYAATFALGWWAQYLRPLPIVASDTPWLSRLGGGVLLVGLLLALVSFALFRRFGTTIIPLRHPSRLATVGPYRFTRNPMYLSLTLMYLGGVAMLNSYWPLILLVIPLAILQRVVIPFEEARLRETFGAEYERYAGRVRRWL